MDHRSVPSHVPGNGPVEARSAQHADRLWPGPGRSQETAKPSTPSRTLRKMSSILLRDEGFLFEISSMSQRKRGFVFGPLVLLAGGWILCGAAQAPQVGRSSLDLDAVADEVSAFLKRSDRTTVSIGQFQSPPQLAAS